MGQYECWIDNHLAPAMIISSEEFERLSSYDSYAYVAIIQLLLAAQMEMVLKLRFQLELVCQIIQWAVCN